MTVTRNLVAGLANSIWSAIIGLAVVPFYLRHLGVEAYGLIGFFLTVQVLLQLLDMGMAPTINREVARAKAAGNISESGKLLHTLAVIYWTMAASIALAILVLAPLIAEYWLQSRQLPSQTIMHAVMLMGLVLACRWPIGLYQGALIGAQRMTVSSAINMTMVTIGSVGVIAILEYVSPTIEAFFVWQACIGFIYAHCIRFAAWRIIGRELAGGFDIGQIRRVLRFSLGVGAISVSGLVLTQLDKVILSKMVSLDAFGKYMLATLIASSLYILIVPVFNTTYPRFSSLVSQRRTEELLFQYGTASRLLASLLFPSVMVLMLLAQPLIGLWTGDAGLATDVAPLVSLLLLAYALHGVMHMPYALMLAHGETRPMFAIYSMLILVMVPLTIVLSVAQGAIGGAKAQLLLFLLYLFVGAWITHRRYFRSYARTWLARDVGMPLGISALVGLCAHLAKPVMWDAVYVQLVAGVALWLLAIALGIYSSRASRLIVMDCWHRFRYK